MLENSDGKHQDNKLLWEGTVKGALLFLSLSQNFGGEKMAKEFKDFTFMGKKLSDLSVKYVSVDFDGDADVNMAMERDME